jgi:hypothetical protein
MPGFNWYLHRLRAMNAREIVLRVRQRLREFTDSHRDPDWTSIRLSANTDYPRLPPIEEAPADLLTALRRDADEILAGRWKAFGHLELKVDDPPKWQRDYHAGIDLQTNESAFRLNHRELPAGADIKLVWELSRWQHLTRLARAAYYLHDQTAARKCVEWLQDWVKNNPPFKGWNWTSPLEAGLRLIQFVWIDALLTDQPHDFGLEQELETLRYEILPSHFHYVWRHRSFGSSANNHLIGELTGLLVALARWPNLAIWGSRMDELQGLWETEVINQFAPDGSNREQALNYQLFSWELSAIAWTAVLSKHRSVSSRVEERLARAATYYVTIQREQDRWDYGDGDNATVLPFWENGSDATWEWRTWMHVQNNTSLGFFWNQFRREISIPNRIEPLEISERTTARGDHDWYLFSHAGMAIRSQKDWFLRFDLSALGYGATNAHGHLDVLHLCLWWRGTAIVIDPGTGAYYGDIPLRNWLASREAHNGPALTGSEFPTRLGPFLWSSDHSVPAWRRPEPDGLQAEWFIPTGTIYRKVQEVENGWCVTDDFLPHEETVDGEFTVRWQFAPGAELTRVDERSFRIKRASVIIYVRASADWDTVITEQPGGAQSTPPEGNLVGTVSPRFRSVKKAPSLLLTAQRGYKTCVFSTTFLASAPK